jgi:hypothetical protein
VEIAQALQQASRDPERLMAVVSRALDASPDIVLTRLRWLHNALHGGDQDESGGAKPASTGRAAPSPTDGPISSPAVGEAAYLEGEVVPFHGDYRSGIASIEAFASKLRRDNAVAEANILHLPLDVDPASSLAGSTLNGNTATGGAKFKIKIVLRARAHENR